MYFFDQKLKSRLLNTFMLFALMLLCSNLFAQSSITVPSVSKQELLEAIANNGSVRLTARLLPEELTYIMPEAQNSNAISPYIIGGSIAARGEFPEFVQILVLASDNQYYAVCGGTLIASNKVLTAGHCADELTQSYYVLTSFYSFSDPVYASDFFSLKAKNRHPNYNATSLDYDIAIFTLNSNASTPKAKIYGGKKALTGQGATVIGTGVLNSSTAATPDQLRKVSTPVVSNAACNSVYGLGSITSRMMCAGFSNNDLGACNGDSGGPLWASVNGQRTQVGIVSFGPIICETANAYSGYARTSALVGFIRQYASATTILVDPAPPIGPKAKSNIVPVMQLLLLE